MKMTSVTKRLTAIMLTLTMILSGINVIPDTARAATTYGEITEGVAASSKTINVLTKKKFYMHPNESINVSVGSKYSKSTVKWSTSTSSIMSYDSKSGYQTKITLKKAGTAKGTVKIGSKSYSFTVVVTNIKVLRTSVTFTSTSSKYAKAREVLYCSSWGTSNESNPSITCSAVGLKSSERKVSASTYSKTHSVYLYPMEFGSGDTKLTITTQNGCKHTYLIKTACPYTKAMETAYSTLKQWQTKNGAELTDSEIQEKINAFSQIPGYREGEKKMSCSVFADALFQYIWEPDYGYVKLSNPIKVLTSKHQFFCHVISTKEVKEEAEDYQSLDEMYKKRSLGDGLSSTVLISKRQPHFYLNDFDAIQIGDLIYEVLAKDIATGQWLLEPSHVCIVMDVGEDGGGKYVIAAESNVDNTGAPVYGLRKQYEENLYIEGFAVISYREPKK